ncbi:sensor histidine kinase [Roseomonas fluvialis]|uniref:histidine kinase n=1 Tax=Roseomonas fluvialis TaxID=1750527 RepID=A0ABM7Y946_9PROT|nr:PAS domain-containing protein [Roseomonas fluvialis]BDG74475.1 hypothetical protein Rmf_44040 [Roseomonas fluvialis]
MPSPAPDEALRSSGSDSVEPPVRDNLIRAARSRLNRASRDQPRGHGFISLLPALTVAVPAFVLALAGQLTWTATVSEATEEVARMAESAAETADRALSGYAVAAARVSDRLAELAAEAPTAFEHRAHALLAELVQEFDPPVIAFALDAAGVPVAASHLFPVPTGQSLSDRDFFQALSGANPPAVHISRMFVGRFDGRLFFAVSRGRWSRPDTQGRGRFDGLVTISVDPNTIGAGLRRLLPHNTDRIALLRDDGVPIASSVIHAEPLQVDSGARAVSALAAAGATSDRHWAGQDGNGEARLEAARRLNGFPVYAVATRPLTAVRAEWRSAFGPYLAFGVPAIAALLALSLRVRSDQLRLVTANATLLRDVERSEDRLERAKRYAMVGTFEVDLTTGRSLRSPEYMAVNGLAPSAARETHADWMRRLHPDDRAAAEARLLNAVADDSRITEYEQTYRIVTPSGEVRWISARGEIERDARGRALVMRGIHVDVTSLRSTEAQLAETDARLVLAQDAVGIGTWEWLPTQGRLYLAQRALQLIRYKSSDTAPPWRDVMRCVLPQDRRLLWRGLREVLAAGTMRVELRIRASAEPGAPTPWIIIRARAVDLGDGKGRRILGVAYDITERKQDEIRAALLAQEVEHRARNAMTLVSGLVRMTTAPTHEEFVATLEGRIRSLSQTITLLGRSRWAGAAIGELVREELAAHLSSAADRRDIRIDGPEVMLDVDATQHVSMAVHELATNSAKYGALSVPDGSIEVTWRMEGATVAMTWKERGGPRVAAAPEHEGFGTFLIRSTIENQLGGTLEMAWEPDGLRCSMRFLPTAR